MIAYILYFNENEYIDSFDIGNKACSVIEDMNKAEIIYNKSEAGYFAERLGCSYKEIKI